MSSFHMDDKMHHESPVMLVVRDPGRRVCLAVANDGMTVQCLVRLKGSTGPYRRWERIIFGCLVSCGSRACAIA